MHKNKTTSFSSGKLRRRDEAIQALPNPMPMMKDIRTTANDWADEPKIIASERDASTSSPIEIAPVMATAPHDQRQVFDDRLSFAITRAGSTIFAIPINWLRLSMPAVTPMKILTMAVIWSDDTSPRFWISQKPATPAPATA